MDLNTKSIVDTLECGSGPEGIIGVGEKVYVANSFEMSVSVFNVSNNSSSKINLSALPKLFALDASGNLWVSTSSGLYSINTKSDQKVDSLLVTNVDGKMAIDGNGEKIYLLTAQPWPATTTEVFVFDVKTKTVGESALISGENFYGIGYNSSSDKIYLGDSKAFAGPGAIYVYDDAGTRLDEQITSVGPNGFTFK
jgi:DNA-binding beta-propeller fold protein YncE